MAQIVLIAEGTYKEGVNNIGDVVSIHEDDVKLGDSYSSFKIVSIPKVKAEEIRASLESKIPETKIVEPEEVNEKITEEITLWNDAGIWKEVKAPVKYPINLAIEPKDLLEKEIVSVIGEKAVSNLRVSDNQSIITLK